MSSPIRVLWVIKTLGFGGAERLVAQLAPLLDRDQIQLDCAFSDERFQDLAPALTSAGVNVIRLFTPGRRFSWIPRLFYTIQDGDYSVVHSHSPLLAAVGRLAVRMSRRRRRISHITTEHAIRQSYHPLTRIATALTSRWDDRCLAVSAMVWSSIRGRVRERTTVTYQGIDIAALEAAAGDISPRTATTHSLRLLSVANLRPEKDFPTLLECCRLIGEHAVPYHLTIAGDCIPEVGRAIMSIPDQLGISDHVTFLGPRSDVPRLMRTHDLLVISSNREAGPVVALEAAALGIPIVSTRVGIMAELFTDGVDCVLVDVGDHEALADAITRVASDPELRSTLTISARKLVETIRIQDVARDLELLYLDLASVQ